MNFYKEIINLSDEELEQKVNDKIKKLEENSSDENVLGYHLDSSPKRKIILQEDDDENDILNIAMRCFYNGYIKKGTKMTYGAIFSITGKVAYNDGRYYYIDDDSYILEFCKYIKDVEIYDEHDLFGYILDFIREYYGYIGDIDREEMFKMILNTEDKYYEPISEHKLSDFKKRGNALCSEYSIMAQNILSVFDIECSIVMGKVRTGKSKGDSHAFNIVSYYDKNENKEKTEIVDFANYIKIYDMNYKEIGAEPFIEEFEDYNDLLLKALLNSEIKIEYEEYSYLIFGDTLLKLGYEKNREYYLENRLTADEIKYVKR